MICFLPLETKQLPFMLARQPCRCKSLVVPGLGQLRHPLHDFMCCSYTCRFQVLIIAHCSPTLNFPACQKLFMCQHRMSGNYNTKFKHDYLHNRTRFVWFLNPCSTHDPWGVPKDVEQGPNMRYTIGKQNNPVETLPGCKPCEIPHSYSQSNAPSRTVFALSFTPKKISSNTPPLPINRPGCGRRWSDHSDASSGAVTELVQSVSKLFKAMPGRDSGLVSLVSFSEQTWCRWCILRFEPVMNVHETHEAIFVLAYLGHVLFLRTTCCRMAWSGQGTSLVLHPQTVVNSLVQMSQLLPILQNLI